MTAHAKLGSQDHAQQGSGPTNALALPGNTDLKSQPLTHAKSGSQDQGQQRSSPSNGLALPGEKKNDPLVMYARNIMTVPSPSSINSSVCSPKDKLKKALKSNLTLFYEQHRS
ncbi:hypothetical protein RHMOL_Rhmol02G0005400 [Rhododendron molle]|uniref:Uncharacterized protein n=2 Tax=Rhododendron molle TaxID=49168 RepID=A0ACC0PLP9_RHOML|nr:hypothetical protein RHMOL_Rhmol02G0005400 [Rhododendron molle]KAI8566004.1 hypothetical protein RHMOL_Rhmol02G0005400 [Rhododendron molle]